MSRPASTTITVLGDGAWGTTLAIHLHGLGHRLRLWSAFPAYARLLHRRRTNPTFLPGIRIPQAIAITADLAEALRGARVVVLAIPSKYLRGVAQRVADLSPAPHLLVSVAKGIEPSTLKRMSQVIHEELGPVRLAVLSGPNVASEIAAGQPASAVIAAADAGLASDAQRLFMSHRLRIYTSRDVIGVELGGALKNPLAIAAGIGDGLGFGANVKAALITRGMVEMARLGVAMGAREETFWGLSGLGDLITTCLSGRNRWLGEQLGRGRSLTRILHTTLAVFEGVETARAAALLGHRHRVELPIIEQVAAVLFARRSPRRALALLMRRLGKAEAA